MAGERAEWGRRASRFGQPDFVLQVAVVFERFQTRGKNEHIVF